MESNQNMPEPSAKFLATKLAYYQRAHAKALELLSDAQVMVEQAELARIEAVAIAEQAERDRCILANQLEREREANATLLAQRERSKTLWIELVSTTPDLSHDELVGLLRAIRQAHPTRDVLKVVNWSSATVPPTLPTCEVCKLDIESGQVSFAGSHWECIRHQTRA